MKFTHRKVLLAEDNDDVRLMLKMALEHEGVEVVAVTTGMDALFEYYKAFHGDAPFPVLLLDCALAGVNGQPSVDGFTVGRNIRNLERFTDSIPRAHHFYYTAKDRDIRQTTLPEEAEADGYFVKGRDDDRVIEAVMGVLNAIP